MIEPSWHACIMVCIVAHNGLMPSALIETHLGADIVSANNGSICTDCRPFPYMSPGILGFSVDGAPGIGNISKYTGRPQENIVFTSYSGINRYVILYLDVVAQYHTR